MKHKCGTKRPYDHASLMALKKKMKIDGQKRIRKPTSPNSIMTLKIQRNIYMMKTRHVFVFIYAQLLLSMNRKVPNPSTDLLGSES